MRAIKQRQESRGRAHFDLTTPIDLGGAMLFSESINPEGLVGQINLAVDHSGTGTNNNVYILGSVQRTGTFNGSDIMFVRSTTPARILVRRSGSTMIRSIPINGTGSGRWQLRLTAASMRSGWTLAMQRIIPTRNCFTHSAATAVRPGQRMCRSATCSTRSWVIRIKQDG